MPSALHSNVFEPFKKNPDLHRIVTFIGYLYTCLSSMSAEFSISGTLEQLTPTKKANNNNKIIVDTLSVKSKMMCTPIPP